MKTNIHIVAIATSLCVTFLVGCGKQNTETASRELSHHHVADSSTELTCECCQDGEHEDPLFIKKAKQQQSQRESQKVDHEHEHDHDHEHSHVPADKPVSFSAGIQRLDNWLHDSSLVTKHHTDALRVLKWLPELAIDSDLPKEDWIVIHNYCVALQESESLESDDWQEFIDAMFDYRLKPTLIRPVVDGRNWH